MILKCGHLVCLVCVFQKNVVKITCVLCGSVSPKKRTRYANPHVFSARRHRCSFHVSCCSLLTTQFPIQFHLTGYLNYVQNVPYMLRISPAGGVDGPAPAVAPLDNRPMCYECQTVRTDKLCAKCDRLPFCAACFRKVHSARSLRRHELQATAESAGSMDMDHAAFAAEQTRCRHHANAELQFYCRPCGQAICGECKRDRHDQHGNVVALLLEVCECARARVCAVVDRWLNGRIDVCRIVRRCRNCSN